MEDMKYTGQLWHFFSVFLTFAFDYDSVSGCRRDNESVAERKPFIWCKYASYFSSTYSILLPCPHSNGRKVQKVKIIYCFLDIWLKVEKYLIDKSARNVACMRRSPHLVFGHSTNNQWAHHPRQSANTVRDAHQDASIARRNVQVIDIKPWWRKNSTKEKKKICLLFVGQTLWTWCFTIWLKLRKGRQQFLGTKDVDLKIKKEIQQQYSATSASLLWEKAATCSADSVRRGHTSTPSPTLTGWMTECPREPAAPAGPPALNY